MGEIPLHWQIMEGSDLGKPVAISKNGSIETKAFTDVAKTIAGRISVIAATMKDEDRNSSNESPSDEQRTETESQNLSQS
jgi:hypothetical protein